MRRCTWEKCPLNLFSKGLCRLHYYRKKKGNDMDAPIPARCFRYAVSCSAGEGLCPNEATRPSRLCAAHYYRKVIRKQPHWDRPLQRSSNRNQAARVKFSGGLRLRPNVRAAVRRRARGSGAAERAFVSTIVEGWWAKRELEQGRSVPMGPAQERRCGHAGCPLVLHSKRLCRLHYYRKKRGRPMDAPIPARTLRAASPCRALGGTCGTSARIAGLCATHYARKRAGEENWDRPIRRSIRAGRTVRLGKFFLRPGAAESIRAVAMKYESAPLAIVGLIVERWWEEIERERAAHPGLAA